MVFVELTAFRNSIALSFAQRFSRKIAQNGEQVAPKINLVKLYWLPISSLGRRKRSADWSSCLIAIFLNMPSISERMATGFSRYLRTIPTKLFSKSGHGSNQSSKIGL